MHFLLFWGNFALTASIQICENCDDQKLWIFWIRCPIFIFRHYSFCRNYVLETNSHFGKKLVLPMKSAFYSFLFRCFRSKRNSKLMQKYAISLVTCFCFQNAFASKNMCIFNRFLVAKCVVHKKKFPVVHPTFFPN